MSPINSSAAVHSDLCVLQVYFQMARTITQLVRRSCPVQVIIKDKNKGEKLKDGLQFPLQVSEYRPKHF